MVDGVARPVGALGFGVVAGSRPELEQLGAVIESLAYDQLWVNDLHRDDASGLATLGVAATNTRRLTLGVGAISLSHRSVESIVTELHSVDVPHDRLVLGVGAGDSRSLALVRDGVASLRQALPGVVIAVAALGPRMCQLAGEIADVVLVSWMAPTRFSWVRERVASGASLAERPPPKLAAYVRVALGRDARRVLADEQARYMANSPGHAASMSAQGAESEPLGLAIEDATTLPRLLAPYRSTTDICIVRSMAPPSGRSNMLDIARAAVAG